MSAHREGEEVADSSINRRDELWYASDSDALDRPKEQIQLLPFFFAQSQDRGNPYLSPTPMTE